SGLAAASRRWAALTPQGQVASVAGYQTWGTDLAHLGVATDPAWRGHGFGHAAASATITAALAEGLLAQWRCRVGNGPSGRLAERLGLRRLGQQAAVVVEPGHT